MKDETSYIKDCCAVTVIAWSVRLAWCYGGAWMQNDSWEYLRLARNLVFHHTFSLGVDGVPPTAFRPPLFSFLIAAWWHGDAEPVAATLLVNTILGALTVGLTYLIARQAFGRKVGLLAAGALAVAPMTCRFTVTVLTEPLFTFCVTLALFCWGRKRWAWAGVAFGLAALTRPTVLPFLLLVGLVALLLPAQRREWRGYATLLLLAFAVTSIWLTRNALTFGRLIPVAAGGWGTNLLCGTLETDTGGRVWDGAAWVPLNWQTHSVTRVDGIFDETEADRVRLRRALARIAENPLYWLRVRAKQYPKLFIDNGDYLLGNYNLPLGEAWRVGRGLVIVVKLIFIGGNLLVMALAMWGLWLARARWGELVHIILWPVFGALVQLPMWIEPRYFLPVMPPVFILAAYALAQARARRQDVR